MSIHYSALSQLYKLQDARLWANYLTSVSLKMGITNISLAACKLNETTYVQGFGTTLGTEKAFTNYSLASFPVLIGSWLTYPPNCHRIQPTFHERPCHVRPLVAKAFSSFCRVARVQIPALKCANWQASHLKLSKPQTLQLKMGVTKVLSAQD